MYVWAAYNPPFGTFTKVRVLTAARTFHNGRSRGNPGRESDVDGLAGGRALDTGPARTYS